MERQEEIYDILRCCNCNRCVDKETGQIVPEPTEGVIMSHTYCHDCLQKAREQQEAEAAEIEAEMAAKQRIMADPGLRYQLLSRRRNGGEDRCLL